MSDNNLWMLNLVINQKRWSNNKYFCKESLHKIYSPIIENGEYRKRTNQEIYQLFKKLPSVH